MADFVLVCTTDASRGLSSDYRRLIASLARCRERTGDRITLYTLFQGVEDRGSADFEQLPPFIKPLFASTRLPLATARNIILREISSSEQLSSHSVIGFPDDDCWFQQDFFACMGELFDNSLEIPFWFCRYGEELVDDRHAYFQGRAARVSDIVRRCSSVTIFCRAPLLGDLEGFDETIGVGTARPGGEDIDFALRLHLAHGPGWCCPHTLVGHVSPEKRVGITRARYFPGSARVLRRYSREHPAIAFEMARKIAVGVVLCARGALPWSTLADIVLRPETPAENVLSWLLARRRGLAIQRRS